MSPEYTITERLADCPEPFEDDSSRLTSETIHPRFAWKRLPDWWEDAAKQFEAIKSLPVGWDSHGAPRPDRRILHSAQRLLACLCQVEGLAKPHINPTPSEGVQFEWENGPYYFELEVVSEWAGTWFLRDDVARKETEGEVFEGEPLEAVVKCLRRAGAAP